MVKSGQFRTKKFTKESYNREKDKYLKIWRPKILKRDTKCRACYSTYKLECAHITPVTIFVKIYGWEGIQLSFRWDNLVTLCNECHRLYHRAFRFNLIGWRYMKARKVNKLFFGIQQTRGYMLTPKTGMKNRIKLY